MLVAAPLNREAFAPFGDVIDADESRQFTINNGLAIRFHDLAHIDVATGNGHPILNIFRVQPRQVPLTVSMMEKHPLGSQAFIPIGPHPFLIVVARAGTHVTPGNLRAFITNGHQGVNFATGTWHHPVIALETQTDFLVVDRGGPGDNLVEVHFDSGQLIEVGLPS